jgi:hypothetical protein
VPSTPRERRARRLRTARPLRSFAPPGGPFRSTLALASEGLSAGALLGLSPSRALSSYDPGSGVSRRRAYAGLDTPTTHVSGRPAFAVAGREPSTDPGFMNPGSVDAPRLRTGARYRRAVARAPSRRHPAPPCPSRHAPPPRGARRWTSKTLAWDRLRRLRVSRSRRDPPFDQSGSVVGPPVARGAGSRGFSSLVDRVPLRTKGPTRRASVSVTRARLHQHTRQQAAGLERHPFAAGDDQAAAGHGIPRRQGR